MEQLHFYYREGCHLCEEMAAVLFKGWPDQLDAMLWHDIDSRPEWQDKYDMRVPVLSLGDDVLCEFFADTAVLERHFGKAINPV